MQHISKAIEEYGYLRYSLVKTLVLLNDALDLRQLTNGKNTTSVYTRNTLVRVKFYP